MLGALTFVHVAISLVGIGSGFVVMYGLLAAKSFGKWTAVFLATTVATSVTGFFFPVEHFMPSHALGIVSLLVLAVAIPARYSYRLVGAWRWLYVGGAVSSLWLNVFVLIVQLFMKVPALKALAPTQSEPPFLLSEVAAMVVFLALGVLAVRRFHPVAAGGLEQTPAASGATT
jgi:hypothetical protein